MRTPPGTSAVFESTTAVRERRLRIQQERESASIDEFIGSKTPKKEATQVVEL